MVSSIAGDLRNQLAPRQQGKGNHNIHHQLSPLVRYLDTFRSLQGSKQVIQPAWAAVLSDRRELHL